MTEHIHLLIRRGRIFEGIFLEDRIDDETKMRRLDEIITLQRKISVEINQNLIGKTMPVLIESVAENQMSF